MLSKHTGTFTAHQHQYLFLGGVGNTCSCLGHLILVIFALNLYSCLRVLVVISKGILIDEILMVENVSDGGDKARKRFGHSLVNFRPLLMSLQNKDVECNSLPAALNVVVLKFLFHYLTWKPGNRIKAC